MGRFPDPKLPLKRLLAGSPERLFSLFFRAISPERATLPLHFEAWGTHARH